MFEYGTLLGGSLREELQNTWYDLTSFLGGRPAYWYLIILGGLILLAWLVSKR